MPLDRRLQAVVLSVALAKRMYWPSTQNGRHSEARRLRAAARRAKGARR